MLWPKFDELVAARRLGDNLGQRKERRADALWRAAKITRWLGMELFGSEDDPDWRVYNGVYTYEQNSYRTKRAGLPDHPFEPRWPSETPPPPQVPP